MDLTILASRQPIGEETAEERFARLFYTQMRAIAFAHSFLIHQVDSGILPSNKPLAPSITSMLERLANLVPIEGAINDAEICDAMNSIVKHSDINPAQMAKEMDARLKRGLVLRILSWLGHNVDRKSDIAIEAAVSTITKHVLERGL